MHTSAQDRYEAIRDEAGVTSAASRTLAFSALLAPTRTLAVSARLAPARTTGLFGTGTAG
eukprot:1751342-Prymnesium_polylepis.2